MATPIDFYYDYSSPYGYLGSERIEALAAKHNREVRWQPILLGAVFKVTGQGPLTNTPMKGDYAMMDFHRSAREHQIPYTQPEKFPLGAVAASRATLWLRDHADAGMQALCTPLIHAVFRAYYVDGRDISSPQVVSEIAVSVGVDATALHEALGDQGVKDGLRTAVEAAIERGVFGSPTFIVDDQMFWGSDRIEMLDRWLASGGW